MQGHAPRVLPKVLLMVLLAAPAWTAAASADKPRIAVSFELLELLYRLKIPAQEIPSLEAGAAADLAAILHTEYPFLELVVDSELEDRVEIQLGESAPETNIRPVSFRLTVVGPRVVEVIEPASVLFRPQKDATKSPGSVEAFRDEIASNFAANLDRKSLIRQLFSKVLLTRQAHALDESDGWFWILPFSKDELGITIEDSVFLVKANLIFPNRSRELEHRAHAWGEFFEDAEVDAIFHNKLMARFEDEDPTKLADLRSSQVQEIMEVRLEDFERLLRTTLAPATPSSLVVDDEEER